MVGQLGVFVYGTLRRGGWNHDRWLAPFLAGPPRPARLPGMVLHHVDGLPALAPAAGATVTGEVATFRPDRHDEALAALDRLEGTADDLYRRMAATVEDGERVWVWIAGPAIAATLGPHTAVPDGDWLAVPGAVR